VGSYRSGWLLSRWLRRTGIRLRTVGYLLLAWRRDIGRNRLGHASADPLQHARHDLMVCRLRSLAGKVFRMRLRVGFEMNYDFPQPTPMIMVLGTHFTRAWLAPSRLGDFRHSRQRPRCLFHPECHYRPGGPNGIAAQRADRTQARCREGSQTDHFLSSLGTSRHISATGNGPAVLDKKPPRRE
jgi:hypothetical protein